MHTSIGKLLEIVSERTVREVVFGARPKSEKLVCDQAHAIITGAAHYVTDDKVIKLIGYDKVQDGFAAMIKAGIRQLPYDPILIEFRDPTRGIGGVVFVRLQSKPMAPIPDMKPEHVDFKYDIFGYPITLTPDPRVGKEEGYIVSTTAPDDPICIAFNTEPEAKTPYTVYAARSHDHSIEDITKRELALDIAEAMSIALLMLNTRGIEKVHVDTGRLNKARLKNHSPKPLISPYTVIRIGHIYDRAGNAHSVTGTGRHMPVHWRAGHVRNVRYGPRAGPELHRPVFVPACLVNFEGEDEIPMPKHEVKL